MKFQGLSATADLVGRRVRVAWEYALDALETPDDVPGVVLRRKERDYDFPPPPVPDPWLVYDSGIFPPAPIPGVLTVLDLPPWEGVEDGLRVSATAISVAQVIGGSPVEILRRVVKVTSSPEAVPLLLQVELLDALGLEPRTPYYYELDDGSAPTVEERERYRASAVPGGTHGLNRKLYDLLPQIYKRHDVRTLPPAFELPGVPEASPSGGQLRRFLDMFGMGLDAMRSSAEGLLDVHDAHRTEARFLPPLSRMIGWEPTHLFGVPLQRNELVTATRLFDVVGTVPALRALVTYQTGWHSQVTEFAQHVVRANDSPRRSVWALEERGGPPAVWQGAEDASDLFAFPPAGATGVGALPAELVSTLIEPFPLRAGMELTITVDNGVPARVRFGPDDFALVGQASAAEVAAAISAAFDDLVADAVLGAVRLRTHAVGPDAAVQVTPAATSLIALNDAPAGPVSTFRDAEDRLRVFYEQKRDAGRSERALYPIPALKTRTATTQASSKADGDTEPARRSIRYKSWGHGEWRGELDVPEWAGEPTSPWASELSDGRIWLSWLDGRRPASSRLRWALGAARAAEPAVITGRRGEPFALQPGAVLTVAGRFGLETFTVLAGDYADPANATAAEVVAAMGAQLVQVSAAAAAGGRIRLSTADVGDGVTLAVELSLSTGARSLGLEARTLSGRGSWDAAIDWTGPLTAPTVWHPLADPSAVRDPLGGLRVFWSEHRGARWELRQAHWSERLTVVTPSGAAQRTTGAWTTWQIADGLPSDDVRAVAVDANGTLWLATAAGLASRRPDNVWTVLTTVDGLGSDDVRDLTFLPDGSLWCATPAGVSELLPNGTFQLITAAGGDLVDDDVRAVAADGHGNAWAATPAGVSRRGPDGSWRSWTAADGLSAGAPRSIAVGAGGRVAVATAAGVSVRGAGPGVGDGQVVDDAAHWTTFVGTSGLPSNDTRAVAWGVGDELVVATASGVALWNGRAWRALGIANGLPSNDVRSVAIAPDGDLLVGTAAGLASGRETSWTVETTADGLPSNVAVGIHSTWSTPVVLADEPGGHREPRAAVDGADRTWLVWSRRSEAGTTPTPTWELRLRRFDPANAAWGWDAVQGVTTAPIAGTSDREPWLEPDAGGGFRVFFSTNREGGRALAWLTLSAAGVPGPLDALPVDGAETSWPATVLGPGGRSWLLHRSDRSVVPAQVGLLPPPGMPGRRSERVPDAGALRLHAGARTPVLAHAARNLGRRTWGDLFTYTPEYPHLVSEDAPADDHLYTRRTVGLYLRQARTGRPVTEEQIERLLQLLRRFLPVNLRLVLIVSPDPLVELIYTSGADLSDAYQDVVPLVEVLGGPLDEFGVAMPLVEFLISNELTSRSASPLDPTTLRRRTWFPDLV